MAKPATNSHPEPGAGFRPAGTPSDEEIRQRRMNDLKRRQELRNKAADAARQNKSLKIILVAIVISMAAGVAGMIGWNAMRADRPGFSLPSEGQVSEPVPSEAFAQFLKDTGGSAPGVTKGGNGEVRGVNALMAFHFCRWLTEKFPPSAGMEFVLPTPADLNKSDFPPGRMEWTREWADQSKGTLKVRGREGEADPAVFEVHVRHRSPAFTFRVTIQPRSAAAP